MTKEQYLNLLNEIILVINKETNHNLKIQYAEIESTYSFKNKETKNENYESDCFESGVICEKCNCEFELDLAVNIDYYNNQYDNKVSFNFTNYLEFRFDSTHNDCCMDMTCEEWIIKGIIE